MLLFRSEEHVRRWLERNGSEIGAIVTLEQQWGLSRAWFDGILDPGFRRRTPDETQATFEGLGLTGPFWSLTG